ncbi:hypothetical protein DL96DRAFT_1821905 [Flagelloscypha sp. PMI_526]|nr:hypothetical protein DL96DRAFT_1821905 [Flagelloscypha sp. PMI_526]
MDSQPSPLFPTTTNSDLSAALESTKDIPSRQEHIALPAITSQENEPSVIRLSSTISFQECATLPEENLFHPSTDCPEFLEEPLALDTTPHDLQGFPYKRQIMLQAIGHERTRQVRQRMVKELLDSDAGDNLTSYFSRYWNGGGFCLACKTPKANQILSCECPDHMYHYECVLSTLKLADTPIICPQCNRIVVPLHSRWAIMSEDEISERRTLLQFLAEPTEQQSHLQASTSVLGKRAISPVPGSHAVKRVRLSLCDDVPKGLNEHDSSVLFPSSLSAAPSAPSSKTEFLLDENSASDASSPSVLRDIELPIVTCLASSDKSTMPPTKSKPFKTPKKSRRQKKSRNQKRNRIIRTLISQGWTAPQPNSIPPPLPAMDSQAVYDPWVFPPPPGGEDIMVQDSPPGPPSTPVNYAPRNNNLRPSFPKRLKTIVAERREREATEQRIATKLLKMGFTPPSWWTSEEPTASPVNQKKRLTMSEIPPPPFHINVDCLPTPPPVKFDSVCLSTPFPESAEKFALDREIIKQRTVAAKGGGKLLCLRLNGVLRKEQEKQHSGFFEKEWLRCFIQPRQLDPGWDDIKNIEIDLPYV